MEILYVTNNQKKFNSCKEVFKDTDIKIEQVKLDIREVQGDPKYVAVEKAKDAYKNLGKPLIINDSSLIIPSLNNFPGAYTKDVEKMLGDIGILKLLDGVSEREAHYLDILVYIDSYGYQVFSSKTLGSISLESFEGDFYPYDKIFIKEGHDYQVAYYGQEEIDKLYSNNTYYDLLKFLNKRKVSRGITFIDNKVLLLHRIRKENDIYLDYYAIPGGGVEDFESIEDACIRELEEETSLDVTINTYLGFESYDSGVCYYFLTNYKTGTPVLGGEEKERNSPDNFYEIKLIDVNLLDTLNMYGNGITMIKNAYKIYKDK